MNSELDCPTTLLDDAPASEDWFGTHLPIAQILSDLVRTERGGKAIGVEGDWGSGKSTVAKLFHSTLSGDKNFAVVTFDAWAHQGDPLRRSFLERLTRELLDRGWLRDKGAWERRLEELKQRRVSTRETQRPHLTTVGRWVSAALLLVPAGTGLLAASAPGERLSFPLLVIGLILSLAPFLFGISLLLSSIVCSRLDPSHERIYPWDIFANESSRETTSETLETPEPTSVEFEGWFLDLLDDGLREEARRFVLVLDNLDRVDREDGLAIWSTLQTFLRPQTNPGKPWESRFWVIVPYATEGLNRLLSFTNESNLDDANQAVSQPATSFVDKTLVTRLYVPPPLLSEWRSYLTERLSEALPRHLIDDFHGIHRIFSTVYMGEGNAPTPRAIKLFVNDIGTLHRQRRHDFPIQHYAYYAALRHRGDDVVKRLRKGELPETALLDILAPEARDSLAAIHFNRDVSLARQLLLEDPIANALTRGSHETLRELWEANPKGFWPVLEVVAAGTAINWKQPRELIAAALALSGSGLWNEAPPAARTSLEVRVRKEAMSVGAWVPFDREMADGLVAIARIIKPDEGTLTRLLAGISGGKVGAESDATTVTYQQWAASLVSVLRGLKTEGLLGESVQVNAPVDPAASLDLAMAIGQQDPDGEFWPNVRFVDLSQLAPNLESLVKSGQFQSSHVLALRVAWNSDPACKWDELVAAISTHLQQPSQIDGPHLVALLDALMILAEHTDSASTALSEIGSQGYALHHFHQAASERHHGAMAALMLVYLEENPSGAEPSAVGNSAAGYQVLLNQLSAVDSSLVGEFVRLIVRYRRLAVVESMLDNFASARPFVLAVLSALAASESAGQFYTPQLVVERWQELEEAQVLSDVVGEIVPMAGLLSVVKGKKFQPGNARLYDLLLQAGATEKEFSTWCVAGLNSLDNKSWDEALRGDTDLLGLTLRLQDASAAISLGLPFKDALVAHTKGVIADQVQVPELLKGRWLGLLQLLEQNYRDLFIRETYDALQQTSGRISSHFFDIFGGELAMYLPRASEPVRKLFVPIVRANNPAGMAWLANQLSGRWNLESFGEEAAAEELRERVTRLQAAADAPEEVGILAAALGVRSVSSND
jgi:hypothetical protein